MTLIIHCIKMQNRYNYVLDLLDNSYKLELIVDHCFTSKIHENMLIQCMGKISL